MTTNLVVTGGGIHMNRWRVGEDRGSKETDGCPLTSSGAVAKCTQRVMVAFLVLHDVAVYWPMV
jgi:hypothetical protein